MASSNVLGVQDAYALINQISAQALGGTGLTATDTSSFVKVAEAIMQTGLESTLNAIGYVLGRTIFSIRPYKAKLSTLERDPERFGMITRKITYLYKGAEKSNDWNTQIDATQLEDGASVDMYTINAPKAVQTCIPGAESLQFHYTRFRDQLKLAFSNETEFIRFWEGVTVEFYNNIETAKESKSRAVLLNRIGAQLYMNVGVVDLVYEYNVTHNTSYTRADLLSTYAEDFWKFAAARIKIDSDRLTDRTAQYHASFDSYDPIVRHTPKARQRMIMYSPAFTGMKAEVYSSLFNPQYLDIGEFEGVNYWQSQLAPASINVKPNVLNTTTGEANAAADYVEADYVLGILYDEEAMGIMPKFDYVAVSPLNAAGNYYNTFVHMLYKSYVDMTENGIVYVMGDIDEESKLLTYLYKTTAGTTYNTNAFFNPTVKTYTQTVANTVENFYLIPVPMQQNAHFTITAGGVTYAADEAIPLEVGANVITIDVVVRGYQPTTYTITVSRAPAAKDGDDDPDQEPKTGGELTGEAKASKSTKSK